MPLNENVPVRRRLAVTMHLKMGSTPASGVIARRPRRVARTPAESPNSESARAAHKVTGEGASHGARGGRAPLSLNKHGLGTMADDARDHKGVTAAR